MHLSAEKLVRFIITNKIAIIITTLISCIFFGYFATKVYVDNETMKTVPDSLKEKVALKELQKQFESPYILLFIAEFHRGTLLEKIDSLTHWAKRFEEITVDGAPGISNTMHIGRVMVPVKGGFLGLKSEYVIPRNHRKTEEEIRKRIHTYGEFTKALVSKDETVLGIVLFIDPNQNRTAVAEKSVLLMEEINRYTDINAYITGESSVPFLLGRFMKRDFSILLPICLLVASLLLYFIFRNVLYVAASLFIIAIALVWIFGIMGLTRVPFSVVTSIVPIILFPVGVANAIHIVKTYTRHRWINDKSFIDSFTETYRELLRPIFLTSITTFFGFGSFVFTDISWTRHFGVLTGIGVMLSLLFTVLLLPLFLLYEKKPKTIAQGTYAAMQIPEPWLIAYKKLLFGTPFWKFFIAFLLVVCAIGFMRVRFESNPIDLFPPKSTIRQSEALITKYFGGTRFFSIILTTNDRTVTTPGLWEEIDSISAHISANEYVGNVESILPLVNRTCMLLNNKPLSNAGISLLLKSKGLFGKKFKHLIDSWITPDRKTVKITVSCKNIPGYKSTDLAASIERYIRERYPHWEIKMAGQALLIDAMVLLLISTQIKSISVSFFFVFVILVILFRSVKIGFVTTIPMILSTLTIFALLGLSNVPINMVTVVIVNTCIGIGIDYAIHFAAGFLFIKDNYPSVVDALMGTLKNKGSVIVFNTFVVGTGFFVLVLSSFPPIRHFGMFIFISMLVSALYALFFLPLCFSIVKWK